MSEEQDEDGLPKELQDKLDEELKKVLEHKGAWLMVRTTEGDTLTGRIVSPEAPVQLCGPHPLQLECVVRYVELNVPVQGPRGMITHTITAVRPDLEADDNPTYIPVSSISRWKKADAEKSALEFVRLRFMPELQEHLREKLQKEQEEMERRARHAGLALPGDPRGIPPHVAAALRRQMGGG